MKEPHKIPSIVPDVTTHVDFSNDDPDAQLNVFLTRTEKAKKLGPTEIKEGTRSFVAKVVLLTFCFIVIIFSLFGCGMFLWGDIERLPGIRDFIQMVSTVISPVVTFILGYYFATKESE